MTLKPAKLSWRCRCRHHCHYRFTNKPLLLLFVDIWIFTSYTFIPFDSCWLCALYAYFTGFIALLHIHAYSCTWNFYSVYFLTDFCLVLSTIQQYTQSQHYRLTSSTDKKNTKYTHAHTNKHIHICIPIDVFEWSLFWMYMSGGSIRLHGCFDVCVDLVKAKI